MGGNDEIRRPSMVGQPPTAKGTPAGKSPGRRGRKPKSAQPVEQSDSEEATVEEKETTAVEDEDGEDSPDEVVTPPPKKKKRGRPADPNSVSAKKKREKEEREKKAAQRLAKKAAKKQKIEEEDEASEELKEEHESEKQESEEEAETSIKEMPSKQVRAFNPFQLFCDYMLRKLMSKDPEEYFTYPVSASVAPDYATVISQPMDFYTIQNKINSDAYKILEELKLDAILICENAMIYNGPHTIYHLAAQKLLNVIKYYFSEDYVEYLRYHLPFGKEIPRSQLNLPEKDLPGRQQVVLTEKRGSTAEKLKLDNPTAKQVLADTPKDLKKKLTTEVPKWPMGYIDNKDGALSLNIVTNTSSTKTAIKLGDIVGKPEIGNPGLVDTFEGVYSTLLPSSYLSYEPFASFAPQYDSTWATLSKRDSDLLINTYGDKENAAGVMQLRQMVMDAGGHYLPIFDGMLNALTDGEHSKIMEALQMNEKDFEKFMEEENNKPTSPNMMRQLLDEVSTLKNLGIDTSFAEEIKTEMNLTEKPSAEELIARNGLYINDLQYLQNQRYSRIVTNLADVPEPTETEIQLTQQITQNFTQQVIEYAVQPQQLVSTNAIHNAIGINDDEECDYDVLREFMQDI
uniref:Bromo domain-containing protein n=1 Tax=Panagrolaimus sp. JU765 TaxID=591449 RepID=A0AC34Q839_9BILA